MNADLAGALQQLDRSWRAFEHNGKPMTKEQVRMALIYGIKKGYKHTWQLTDRDIDIAIGRIFKCKCGFKSGDSYCFTVHLDCCNGEKPKQLPFACLSDEQDCKAQCNACKFIENGIKNG